VLYTMMEIMRACLYRLRWRDTKLRTLSLPCWNTLFSLFLPPDTLVIRDVLESKPRKYWHCDLNAHFNAVKNGQQNAV